MYEALGLAVGVSQRRLPTAMPFAIAQSNGWTYGRVKCTSGAFLQPVCGDFAANKHLSFYLYGQEAPGHYGLDRP